MTSFHRRVHFLVIMSDISTVMASYYEEHRQKNIERNQKLLASLGLLQVREELSVASKKRQVKQVKKRKAVSKEEIGEPSKARRQSGRLQGVKGPDYSASKIICLGEFATTSRKKGVSGKGSSLAYQPHADEYYTVSNIDALRGCTTNYDKRKYTGIVLPGSCFGPTNKFNFSEHGNRNLIVLLCY